MIFIRVFATLFFQAEDGIRDLVRSRGLGDVYKRQIINMIVQSPKKRKHGKRRPTCQAEHTNIRVVFEMSVNFSHPALFEIDDILVHKTNIISIACLLYTSDAADERSSVDLGGRRIIKKKKNKKHKKKKQNKKNKKHK